MTIPPQEHIARRAALAAALADEGVDAWVAYGDDRQFAGADHVRYLTGLQPHFESALVIGTPDSTVVLTGPETLGYAGIATSGMGIDGIHAITQLAHPGLAYRSIPLVDGAALARDRLGGASRIGLLGVGHAPAGLITAIFDPLEAAGVVLVDAEPTAYRLRARKSSAEQALIDTAFAVAAAGMQAAAAAILPGASERSVAAAAQARMLEAGAEGFGIDAMVAAGPTHSRTILARSTQRRIERGEAVAVTLCPRVDGYHACLARAFSVGPSPDVERRVAAARATQRAGLQALELGGPGRTAVEACSVVVAEHFPEAAITDVWVHSTGMVEFEPPLFTAGSDAAIDDGAAFNIDVPIFEAPWGGMRLEDGFAVEEGRIRPRLENADQLVPVVL